jgi:hypothetical protein
MGFTISTTVAYRQTRGIRGVLGYPPKRKWLMRGGGAGSTTRQDVTWRTSLIYSPLNYALQKLGILSTDYERSLLQLSVT